MKSRLQCLATGVLVGVLGCAPSERASESSVPRVRDIESPAPAGSAEPNLAARDGRIYSSWLVETEGAEAFQYAVFERGSWSAPRTIASGDSFFANWADFPSLVPLADGSLAAHWLWKTGEDTYAYGVRLARSADGATWSPPAVPHRDGTPTEHGFVSLVDDPAGGATLVWLDGRQYAGKEEGDPSGQTCLVAARWDAGGLGPETILDERVCDCCQTAAARTASGVLVAYRDRSPDEVRDIHLVRREGGTWTEPYPLARDGWQIPGCPVNGPALAARDHAVAAAWFTMKGDSARVQVAFSADAGATFSAPLRIDDGKPLGRVDVAFLPNGDALAVWLETTDAGEASIRARHVTQDLRAGQSFEVAPTSAKRASGFPHIVASGQEIWFSWTEDSTPSRVHLAALEVPARWR